MEIQLHKMSPLLPIEIIFVQIHYNHTKSYKIQFESVQIINLLIISIDTLKGIKYRYPALNKNESHLTTLGILRVVCPSCQFTRHVT